MNLELFYRAFVKHPDVTNPFSLSRKDFDAKFPELNQDAGRAFWRVREFYERLEQITGHLRDLKGDLEPTRRMLQEK